MVAGAPQLDEIRSCARLNASTWPYPCRKSPNVGGCTPSTFQFNIGIEFVHAFRTDTMGELDLGVGSHLALDLVPVTFIIPDFLAG